MIDMIGIFAIVAIVAIIGISVMVAVSVTFCMMFWKTHWRDEIDDFWF